MLIYDRRKNETVDVIASSYIWKYEEEKDSAFFKAIAAMFPECDLCISEWACFGDGRFVGLSDEKEPDQAADGQYLKPRFAVIIDANHRICNITPKHLEQFAEYNDLHFDMNMIQSEIWYYQGELDAMDKKCDKIRKAIDWEV